MAAETVRSDYDQLKSSASSFKSQADAIDKMNNDVRSAMDTLQSGDWIGEGARKFLAEMNDSVLPTLKRLHAALDQSARVTTQISQVMKQAEEQASSTFHL
jgi:WXG100 family type VII secretion target